MLILKPRTYISFKKCKNLLVSISYWIRFLLNSHWILSHYNISHGSFFISHDNSTTFHRLKYCCCFFLPYIRFWGMSGMAWRMQFAMLFLLREEVLWWYLAYRFIFNLLQLLCCIIWMQILLLILMFIDIILEWSDEQQSSQIRVIRALRSLFLIDNYLLSGVRRYVIYLYTELTSCRFTACYFFAEFYGIFLPVLKCWMFCYFSSSLFVYSLLLVSSVSTSIAHLLVL